MTEGPIRKALNRRNPTLMYTVVYSVDYVDIKEEQRQKINEYVVARLRKDYAIDTKSVSVQGKPIRNSSKLTVQIVTNDQRLTDEHEDIMKDITADSIRHAVQENPQYRRVKLLTYNWQAV